jgi:hypothetical protein
MLCDQSAGLDVALEEQDDPLDSHALRWLLAYRSPSAAERAIRAMRSLVEWPGR